MEYKVLVCEDDSAIRTVTKIILANQGYSVLGCSSGKEALEIIKREQPHLLVCDVSLPDKNGDEITRELRNAKVTADMPVILFSALNNIKSLALEAGANIFLPKPFDIEDLEKAIKKLLHEKFPEGV